MIDLIQEDQQGTELLRSVVQDEMSSGQELLEAHRLLNGAKAAASRSLSKREGGQIRYDAHTSKKETSAKLSQADLDRARETEIQRFYEVNGRGFASFRYARSACLPCTSRRTWSPASAATNTETALPSS